MKKTHNLSVDSIRKIGRGRKACVKRVKPKKSVFQIGRIFWLRDGIYKLEELTNPKRCNKQVFMIFRPIRIKTLDNKTSYTVYQLIGGGI